MPRNSAGGNISAGVRPDRPSLAGLLGRQHLPCHHAHAFPQQSPYAVHLEQKKLILDCQVLPGQQLDQVHGSAFWRYELRFSLTRLQRRVTYSFAIRELAGLSQSHER